MTADPIEPGDIELALAETLTVETPALGAFIPAPIRALIYWLFAGWSAAWLVIESNANPHWIWRAVNGGVGALVGALAASNTRHVG